jgi:hypothetical protein
MAAASLRKFNHDAPAETPPAKSQGRETAATLLSLFLLAAGLLLALALSFIVELPIE